MSLIDKFLDAIKLNDEGYEEDEFLDDETDDEAEYQDTKVKRRFFSRMEDDDIYDGSEDSGKKPVSAEPEPKPAPKAAPKQQPVRREKASRPKAKNVPKRKSSGSMEVSVIKPTSMEDARDIADTLLDDCTIVLNLEGLDVDTAQRIIDFTCGACYSLGGSIQMISSYIFILTPASVDISGDYQSILSDAFDIPAMRSQY